MTAHPEGCIDSRGKEYMTGIFDRISKSLGTNSPKEAIALFRNMMSEMDLHNPVAANREQELEMLSTSVNPVRLKNNPVELSYQVLHGLYNNILK